MSTVNKISIKQYFPPKNTKAIAVRKKNTLATKNTKKEVIVLCDDTTDEDNENDDENDDNSYIDNETNSSLSYVLNNDSEVSSANKCIQNNISCKRKEIINITNSNSSLSSSICMETTESTIIHTNISSDINDKNDKCIVVIHDNKSLLNKTENENTISISIIAEDEGNSNNHNNNQDASKINETVLLLQTKEKEVSSFIKKQEEHQNNDDNNINNSTDTDTNNNNNKYPIIKSAYIQHISEICHTISFDARWNNILQEEKQTLNNNEQQQQHWNIISSFANVYIPYDASATTNTTPTANNNNSSDNDPKENNSHVEVRAIHLLSRLLHRKGPWFRLDDLYRRYYYNNNNTLQDFLQDVQYLIDQNWIRNCSCSCNKNTTSSSSSSIECVIILDNNHTISLFNQNEMSLFKRKIIGISDTKKSTTTSITFEKYIQSQSKLYDYFSSSSSSSNTNNTLNAKKEKDDTNCFCHFINDIVIQNIVSKYDDKKEVAAILLDDTTTTPTTGMIIRLSEEPLELLHRVMRIYLIANGGPGGMMRSSLSIHNENATRWDKIIHRSPGLLYRLKLVSNFDYMHLYTPLKSSSSLDMMYNVRVFIDGDAFWNWEMAVELRSFVNTLFYSLELCSTGNSSSYKEEEEEDSDHYFIYERNKGLDMNCTDHRRILFNHFCCSRQSSLTKNKQKETNNRVFIALEERISQYHHDHKTSTSTKHETQLFLLSFTLQYILKYRFQTSITTNEMEHLFSKPWLRHLKWEGILCYILKDIIELIEKRHSYDIAVDMLGTILFVEEDVVKESYLSLCLSRRTRGKALERYAIDLKHHVTSKQEQLWKPKKKKMILTKLCTSKIQNILINLNSNATIPFCTIRKLTKRIQRDKTLIKINTHRDAWNIEMMELCLRMNNNSNNHNVTHTIMNQQEWEPAIDIIQANAITKYEEAHTNPKAGKRCKYIGYENSTNSENGDLITHRSLSVEELAMEEYHFGRVIQQQQNSSSSPDDTNARGWIGWHDEGRTIRTLFRILCFDTLLQYTSTHSQEEDFTIFLSPYQSSPLDLHIGHCIIHTAAAKGNDNNSQQQQQKVIRGFYERRRSQMEQLFHKFENMNAQSIADYVYSCIQQRLQKHQLLQTSTSSRNIQMQSDYLMTNDVKELRTLSMIAAGLGGTVLSSIFRCLCFDCRHYSGGMPDLLLCRAYYQQPPEKKLQQHQLDFVDLADWIGEEFVLLQKNGNHFFFRDLRRDEEDFLGCENDKHKNNQNQNQDTTSSQQQEIYDIELPDKLTLIHNDDSNNEKVITIECMFVEVKSLNDTLDDRQKDWLNVLDRVGTARVCRFQNTSRSSND